MAAHDDDWVFVDIAGNEVSKDDPAVQTRYTRRDFRALDKAVVFGAAKARATDEDAPDLVDDETADPPAPAASVKHGRR